MTAARHINGCFSRTAFSRPTLRRRRSLPFHRTAQTDRREQEIGWAYKVLRRGRIVGIFNHARSETKFSSNGNHTAYSHRVSFRAKIVAKMTTRKPDLEAAHRHCYKCRKEVMASEICGCFHCLATFPPGEIEEWLDDGQTAMCPKCGIDSVIGSASGFSIDEHFLESMNQRWFSCGGPPANRVH